MLVRRVFIFLSCVAGAFVASAMAQQVSNTGTTIDNSQIAPLITAAIDDGHLVRLPGNTRPEANAKNDRGRFEDDFRMDHMILQLRRSPAQEQSLGEYIDQLHDPASPHFHQWLTAQQLGEKYGLAQADIDRITGWLKSHGFSVNSVSPTRMTIDFSGSAGSVRQAFHTEIHKLQVNGVDHIANMRDPGIPEALAPAVAGIVSLHDFKPHPMHLSHADYTLGGCSGCYVVAPADLATIYSLNPLFSKGISGQGQTIVVVEDTDVYSTSDWNTFRSTFGLSSYTSGSFSQVHPNSSGSSCTDPGITSNDGEATLDVEWASAAAPSAAIELASCSDTVTNFGGFIALQNLLNSSTPPSIVSISYGESETKDGTTFNASISSMYQQAASEGVSVFVSAGDAAAALSDQQRCATSPCEAIDGINVNGWASTIYNVAVGGTDFGDTASRTNSTYWSSGNNSTYGSALSYIPEIPWNNSCASMLFANYAGFATAYGTNGFCNSSNGANFLNVTGGGGGPSACATGIPSVSGVVSGTCAGYSKPSWQSVFGNPSDGVRDLPDVSLFAANGLWGHAYVYCFSDPGNHGSPCTGAPSGWSSAGGTSFAAPIMAAIQSLVNQYTGTKWGNPNPTYYSLAALEYGASGDSTCNSSIGNAVGGGCIFYDVTQGDMDVPCVRNSGTLFNCYLPSGTYGVLSTSNSAYQPAYGTHTGWDFATGIGTINAYNLVTNFSPKTITTTTLAITPKATVAVGTSVSLTATITPVPPNGETVSFVDMNSGSTLGTGTTSSGTATFTSTIIAGGTYNVEAKYPGDATLASSTSGGSALSVQDFSLTPSALSINISGPGQSGSGIVTFSLLGGLTQVPSFSCSGLPSESTCTFTAASATSETVTIGTTAASWLSSPLGHGNHLFYAALFPGLFGLVLTARRPKQKVRTVLGPVALLVVLTLLMPACTGASTRGGGNNHNPGTPVGQSNVTITATESGISHNVIVNLNVQ